MIATGGHSERSAECDSSTPRLRRSARNDSRRDSRGPAKVGVCEANLHQPMNSEEPRAVSSWQDRMHDLLGHDAKTARRALVRSKGYAATVVATLALGIGAAV